MCHHIVIGDWLSRFKCYICLDVSFELFDVPICDPLRLIFAACCCVGVTRNTCRMIGRRWVVPLRKATLTAYVCCWMPGPTRMRRAMCVVGHCITVFGCFITIVWVDDILHAFDQWKSLLLEHSRKCVCGCSFGTDVCSLCPFDGDDLFEKRLQNWSLINTCRMDTQFWCVQFGKVMRSACGCCSMPEPTLRLKTRCESGFVIVCVAFLSASMVIVVTFYSEYLQHAACCFHLNFGHDSATLLEKHYS